MAVEKSDAPSAEKSVDSVGNTVVADVGVPNPDSLRARAEDLPESDPVQKAVKQGMLADTAQAEAKAKAKVVDESPRAGDAPSGGALKETAGIASDGKRGEEYARAKAARRWGWTPPGK